MKRSLLVLAAVVVGGVVVLAQMGPLAGGGKFPVPHSPEELVQVLERETTWLSGLNISAPGWDKALASLQSSLDSLKGEEKPAPETLSQLSVSLHLVLDILERSAVKGAMGKIRAQETPEWLTKYLAEATQGMGADEAAQVKAIVEGFVKGLHQLMAQRGAGRVAAAARARFGHGMAGEGRQGPAVMGRRRPGAAPSAPEVPAEFKVWAKGYLEGVTSVLGEEEANKVRTICLGAIKAGREAQKQREENARHFLKLRIISAQLDMFIVNHASQE